MHINRVLTLLETIAVSGRPLSAPEVQRATGLPRPTCYRLLQTLADHGLLDDPEHQFRYVIGERLIRLALLGRSDVDLRQAVAPILKDAAIGLGEAVFLSRLRHYEVEIIHVETPTDPRRDYIHPGLGSRPMHACSCSKAIAAFADENFQERILNGVLRPYTGQTKISQEVLRHEFEEVRERGYAECVEEIEVGVSSVAAPVLVGEDLATFSVGATGPIRRFTDARRSNVGMKLKKLAVRVGTAITLSSS